MNDIKVQIGCRYEGEPWDRPALRQMPRHWVLEETKVSPWRVLARYLLKIITG